MCAPVTLAAQDNYEIQVHGSETVAAGATMFELHSKGQTRVWGMGFG